MHKHFCLLLIFFIVAGCHSVKPPPAQSLELPPCNRVMGIDVSHYQRSIDWAKVKADGKVFAWAKATEGTHYVDRTFKTNASNACAAGVIFGAYHFARYDINPAVAEADFFWSIARDCLTPDGHYLQPMLDIEHAPAKGQDREFLTQWVNDWCSHVRALGAAQGVTIVPLIYCNLNFARSRFTPAVQENWPLDYAYWPKGGGADPLKFNPPPPGVWKSWQFWQYGGSVVKGVRGKCDSDVLNGDANVLRDYIIGSPGRWTDGAAVEVGSTPIQVFPTPATGTSFKMVPAHTAGIILQGPVYRDSYQRWQVRFKNGLTGWCTEELIDVKPSAVAAAQQNGAR